MPERYKVLLSAYSCRPGYGSESGIGWNMALEVAKAHDVTVLTRLSNRARIQQGLEALPPGTPVPRFAFFEHSPLALLAKRWMPGLSWWCYQSWQGRACPEVARLQRQFRFDLLHHVTWASYRSSPAVWGHGVPTVWGPVTGVAATPWQLLPWRWPRELLHETLRNLSNRRATTRLARAADFCSAVLVSTEETRKAFAHSGVATWLVPEAGIHETASPQRHAPRPHLRLLFAGRLRFYKGVHFALRGLKTAGVGAELAVFGDGPLRRPMQRLARQLGLGSQVEFHGWVPRDSLLKLYAEFDVFLFPSLHDGIPQALLEAMACGLPVICLDCGGPGQVVAEGCGFKIPLRRLEEIVGGLAQAIACYDQRRELVPVHGLNAWRHAMQHYRWERLGEQVHAVYQHVLG